MRLSGTVVLIAVLMGAPAILLGQQVDPSVPAIDPTAHARVQDPDQPLSPLLPGGSSAWTGQPIMSEVPSSSAYRSYQKLVSASAASQFSGSTGASTWGPAAVTPSTSSTPLNAGPTPDLASTNTVRAHALSMTLRSKVGGSSRKLNLETMTEQGQSTKAGPSQSGPSPEEIAEALGVQQNGSSNSELKLRKLKQANTRSARLRLNNPFQSRSDAATAGRWGADSSSTNAMAQQKHESGMLLHYGFNARTERKKHRRHGAAASASAH
jgi:hypothetical protein